jgi:hypothetical protein
VSIESLTVETLVAMSTKIAADETVDIVEREVLSPHSLLFSETVFTNGISVLDLNDILRAPYVCKAWNKFCSGPLKLNPHFGDKMREKFNENLEVMEKFATKRAEEDKMLHQRCLLLVLESQMLLVFQFTLLMYCDSFCSASLRTTRRSTAWRRRPWATSATNWPS